MRNFARRNSKCAIVELVPAIKKAVKIPLVADIHFDYRLAVACVKAGVDAIRINPGNIGSDERVREVAAACADRKIPIRIGVNSGSLEKDLLKNTVGLLRRHLQKVLCITSHFWKNFNLMILLSQLNHPMLIG
jgi:4-hydroxy-3-methylbut-2-en-1-yl diphosphate synthase IspG/GcpE